MNRSEFIDEVSGIAEVGRRCRAASPKVRLVEALIIGAMAGTTAVLVLVAILQFSK